MRTLFFKTIFIFIVVACVQAITVFPENPSVYNHYLINNVTFSAGDKEVDAEISSRVQFLKKDERFYYDYLISDISNLMKSGLVKDVSVKIRTTAYKEINIYLELVLNAKIEKIQLSNVTVLDEESIVVSLNNKTGEFVDYSFIKKDVAIIEQKYKDNGYVLAKVSNVFFVDEYSTLIYNVEEGEISEIFLNGVEDINRQLVYREMLLHPGKVLNMNALREDRLAVMKLGYFSKVGVPKVLPSPDYPGKIDVVYDLTERKINNLQIGLEQLPNDLYSLTFGVRFPNFRNQGDGIYLKAQTLVRGILEDYNYYFTYNEPWPFGMKTPFNLLLWHQVNKENVLGTSTSVSVRRNGWEANLQPLFFDDKRLLVGYSNEQVEDTTATYVPYTTNAIRMAFIQNTIKGLNHPTKGTRTAIEIEKGNDFFGLVSLGGITYSKYEVRYSIFHEIFPGSVIGANFEAGFLDSDDNTILLFEQDIFNVGGSYSLRGYPDSYASSSSTISGKKKVLGNLEYRVLLLDWLQFAVFTDVGYATNTSMHPRNYKWGGGVGLRLFTPLVPIRLDLGYSDEEGYILHFGLGQLF